MASVSVIEDGGDVCKVDQKEWEGSSRNQGCDGPKYQCDFLGWCCIRKEGKKGCRRQLSLFCWRRHILRLFGRLSD